jgi:hypothetical protein
VVIVKKYKVVIVKKYKSNPHQHVLVGSNAGSLEE